MFTQYPQSQNRANSPIIIYTQHIDVICNSVTELVNSLHLIVRVHCYQAGKTA